MTTRSRSASFGICILTYLVALVAGVAAAWPLRDAHPLLVAGVADVVATVVVFAFSFAFRNSSLYDPYWSVVPIALALYWTLHPEHAAAHPALTWGVVALVTLWGLRLTWNWARGWTGLNHEDWRYGMLAEQSGPWYWLVSFSGIHLFPTVMVFGGMLSVYALIATPSSGPTLTWAVAALVTLGAIAIETVADQQLLRWRRSKPDEMAFMQGGLWDWSRHPNYFGEVAFWWGLSLCAVAVDPANAWVFVGPVAMTGLFVFISVPMMEKRTLAKRPDYAAHMERTSMLLPLPPRRAEDGLAELS
jgi:steroid 5-alpha reductase family enzyme